MTKIDNGWRVGDVVATIASVAGIAVLSLAAGCGVLVVPTQTTETQPGDTGDGDVVWAWQQGRVEAGYQFHGDTTDAEGNVHTNCYSQANLDNVRVVECHDGYVEFWDYWGDYDEHTYCWVRWNDERGDSTIECGDGFRIESY